MREHGWSFQVKRKKSYLNFRPIMSYRGFSSNYAIQGPNVIKLSGTNIGAKLQSLEGDIITKIYKIGLLSLLKQSNSIN